MVKSKKLTVAVIDTETTMRNEHSHLIFDFAFVIGNVYDDNSYDILEKNYPSILTLVSSQL